MKCDIDLIGYREKSLSADEAKKVSRHLKTCPECARELDMLKKSENLFNSIFEKEPDFLCPDTDMMCALVMDDLLPKDKKKLQNHVNSCPFCREKLAALQEADGFKVKMPLKEKWHPLPEGLKAQIAEKPKSMREQVKEALETLKSTGAGILTDVEELTDRLLAGPQGSSPAYALDREITMPSQTDLKLRMPQTPVEIQLEIENFIVEIKTEPGGTRIKVSRYGKPAGDIRIKATKSTGDKVTAVTDENGEVII